MATMYAPGARRSAAPSYSPRSALTSEALYDDQVTKDLLDAMLSAVQPAGVGQSQAGVNLGEALGSGTSIADFNLNGGGEGIGDSGGTAPAGGPAGLGVVGDIGQAFSALGVLGQDSTMAQLGQTLGQVATVGTAVGQAAQGNIGQAAMTVAPMGLSALGVPSSVIGLGQLGLSAMSPTSTSQTNTSNALALGLSLAVPPLGLVNTAFNSINHAFNTNLPTIQSIANSAQTAALAAEANALAEALNIDSLDALMSITGAFGTAPSSSTAPSSIGVTGAEAASADSGGTAADGGSSAGDGSGVGDGTGGVY
jgi:hypothetical protein